MSEIKKSYTIPSTQARLSPSVDFVGYIYPQFLSIGSLGTLTGIDVLISSLGSSVKQSGFLLAGITNMQETFARDVYSRRALGNYEVIQNVPGKVSVSLTLDKVIFYNDSNLLDSLLQVNYNGSIKQTMPLMIIKNMQSPNDEMKTIIFLDCWFKNEQITYDLSGKILTTSRFSVECARVFTPLDILDSGLNALISAVPEIQQISNAFSQASFSLDLPI